MIEQFNIPTGKYEAEIHLKAQQFIVEEFLADINEHRLNSVSQISGLLHAKKDELDKELEGY